ncbi:hypothetical protein Tco_1329837 [Tanacetum coccineum]
MERNPRNKALGRPLVKISTYENEKKREENRLVPKQRARPFPHSRPSPPSHPKSFLAQPLLIVHNTCNMASRWTRSLPSRLFTDPRPLPRSHPKPSRLNFQRHNAPSSWNKLDQEWNLLSRLQPVIITSQPLQDNTRFPAVSAPKRVLCGDKQQLGAGEQVGEHYGVGSSNRDGFGCDRGRGRGLVDP